MISFKYLSHARARELEKPPRARKDDEGHLRVAQNGQLVCLFQQSTPALRKGDLPASSVLDPPDLYLPTGNGATLFAGLELPIIVALGLPQGPPGMVKLGGYFFPGGGSSGVEDSAVEAGHAAGREWCGRGELEARRWGARRLLLGSKRSHSQLTKLRREVRVDDGR